MPCTLRRRLTHRIPLVAIVLIASILTVPAAAQRVDENTVPYLDARNVPPQPVTWKGAFADSLRLLMIEHAVRVVAQPKTRAELGGPFMKDYARSVRWPKTWRDGDGWVVN